MTNDPTQELMKLKSHIEQAKTEAARIEGQISQLEAQRSTEFACHDDAEAQDYLTELEADVARLEAEILEGVRVVKEALGW